MGQEGQGDMAFQTFQYIQLKKKKGYLRHLLSIVVNTIHVAARSINIDFFFCLLTQICWYILNRVTHFIVEFLIIFIIQYLAPSIL